MTSLQLLLEAFSLNVGEQWLEHQLEVALEHVLEAVDRQTDAVVGDAALREVVGSDLLRPVAGPDLAASIRCPFGVEFGFLDLF